MKLKKKITFYTNIDVEIVGITLLSTNEYEATKEHIPPIDYWWWLRSPGDRYGAACVRPGGVGDGHSVYVNSDSVAVRPVLCLKSKDLKVGDEFVFDGKIWTYVGDELAICNEILCEMSFRSNWRARDANNYEASDVKQYLDKWLKEAGKNE